VVSSFKSLPHAVIKLGDLAMKTYWVVNGVVYWTYSEALEAMKG